VSRGAARAEKPELLRSGKLPLPVFRGYVRSAMLLLLPRDQCRALVL
jgi:hypothetical protein